MLRLSSYIDYLKRQLIELGELAFFTKRFFKELFKPPYEFNEFLRQCYQMGNRSLVLVGITGFIIGLVLTLQTRPTLIEFGAESITDLNVKLNQIILWNSKLEIFTNLEALDAVDINWDNMVTAKIAKYINVSLNFRLFYDKDISLKKS